MKEGGIGIYEKFKHSPKQSEPLGEDAGSASDSRRIPREGRRPSP